MRRIAPLALILVLVLMSATHAGAQADDEIQVVSVDSTNAPTVEMVIAVPGAIGEVTPSPSSFAVSENGEIRPVRVTPLSGTVDVVLVVDTSGSMNAGDAIASAKTAAIEFIERTPEDTSIAIVGFGAQPIVAGSLSNDKGQAIAAVEALQARGETALWDALVSASELLREPSDNSSSSVVVLSDGGDTVSTAVQAQAIRALNDKEASLYAVVLQTGETNESELRTAVNGVGGQFVTTDSTDRLQALYADIADRLTHRYVMTFETVGGGERSVVLSVAVDNAVATARATVRVPELATQEQAPAALRQAAVPAELGRVVAAEAGWMGTPLLFWAGVAMVAVALGIIMFSIVMPATRVALGPGTGGPVARASSANERLSGAVDDLIERRDRDSTLNLTLDAAGLSIRPGEFVVIFGVALVGTGLVGAVIGGRIGSAVLVALAAVLGIAYVNLRVSRRRDRFAGQLTETLTILTGSLRAGRGLPQALELVAQEGTSPTSDEFRRVVVESRVGRDPIDSLMGVAERMDNEDMRWITQAIAINRELGGDLVEVLDNVGDTIRDRVRVQRQVRALSAEGRISGWILLALPILMFFYMQAVNPDYAGLLINTTPGLTMLVIGVVAMVLGGLWIRNLVDVKY